jgi:WD40 repeat protein
MMLKDPEINPIIFYRLAWSHDGTRIAGGGVAKCLVWDAQSAAWLRTLADDLNQGELEFSPVSSDLLSLTTSSATSEWKLYDVTKGVLRGSLQLAASNSASRVAFAPKGDEVLVAGATSSGAGNAPLFSLLAGGAGASSVIIWDVDRNRPADEIKNIPLVQAVALSADGRQLLVGTAQSLLLYKQAGGKWTNSPAVASVPGVVGLWWLPGSKNDFAALTSTGQLNVWDARNPKKPAYFSAGNVERPVSFSRDGKRVAFLSSAALSVQSLAAGGKTAAGPFGNASPLGGAGGPLTGAPTGNCAATAFSPVNDLLATGYYDGRVVIRDEDADRDLETFTGPGQVYSLAWSPRGDRLASAHHGSICIWDTSRFAASTAGEEPAAAPRTPAPPATSAKRDDVAAKLKEAQGAIADKDWATTNALITELEAADLRPAEKVTFMRLKRDLSASADRLIQQANKIKSQDPDKALQLLDEAMQIDPNGPAGKKAAKALGLCP